MSSCCGRDCEDDCEEDFEDDDGDVGDGTSPSSGSFNTSSMVVVVVVAIFKIYLVAYDSVAVAVTVYDSTARQ